MIAAGREFAGITLNWNLNVLKTSGNRLLTAQAGAWGRRLDIAWQASFSAVAGFDRRRNPVGHLALDVLLIGFRFRVRRYGAMCRLSPRDRFQANGQRPRPNHDESPGHPRADAGAACRTCRPCQRCQVSGRTLRRTAVGGGTGRPEGSGGGEIALALGGRGRKKRNHLYRPERPGSIRAEPGELVSEDREAGCHHRSGKTTGGCLRGPGGLVEPPRERPLLELPHDP